MSMHSVMVSGMAKKKLAAAVELGRRGGKARAKALSKKRASEIGRKASRVRWRKARKKP